MSTATHRADDVLKRAHAIGTYYGFAPLSSLAASRRGKGAKEAMPDTIALEALDPAAREVATLLKHVRDAGLTPSTLQPLFVWHTNAASGRPSPKQIIIQFHVLGVEHAIADAVLIRAVRSLVHDLVKTEPTLRLNSMGDRETRGRFARELTSFFRKQGATLPQDCVASARQGDVFGAAELLCLSDEAGELPSPTDHLSEASRKHFEGVLEYLESTDTPYELAPSLLSRGTSWSETCFEIAGAEGIQAWGSRYNDFARPFFKSHVPSVGAVVRIAVEGKEPVTPIKQKSSPRFVFVHIGDEAKRECMKMTDDLRRARIPLTQSIGIASLTEQMRYVDMVNPPYVLIMGRKEALERSVILRERATHTETFIPLDHLVDMLKQVG
ncbi:MAG: His/Gly/Thr/Pro-type tRNA ligase C-terminal domain-containing protein [Patescibacteria group bacterium]